MSRRPRLLDLFGAQGGASAGFQAAGFHVTAVDLDADALARNPADETVQGDALAFLREHHGEFDVLAGSPPCHDHTSLRSVSGVDGTGHLLPDTLAAFASLSAGRPWVVENVEGARVNMPGALTLCGTEFGLSVHDKAGELRHLKRHRLFLSNVWLMGAGGCSCSGRRIAGVYGTGGEGGSGHGYKVSNEGARARTLLGVPWMNQSGAALCIPPVYAEHVGWQLRAALDLVA